MSEIEQIEGKIRSQQSAADDPGPQPERGEDAGFLWDFWYPAARSSVIQARRLATELRESSQLWRLSSPKTATANAAIPTSLFNRL